MGRPRVRGLPSPLPGDPPQLPRPEVDDLPKPVMTIDEAARYLRIGPNVALRAAKDGRLPVRRFGDRVIRVLLSDLEPQYRILAADELADMVRTLTRDQVQALMGRLQQLAEIEDEQAADLPSRTPSIRQEMAHGQRPTPLRQPS